MEKDNNILERVQKVINLYLEQENSLNAIERHLQLLSEIKTEDDDKLTSSIETIRVHIKVLKTHTAYNHLVEVESENIKLYKEQVKESEIDNRDRKQRHVESSLGEMLHFDCKTQPITKKKRGRGRPKGSKNKPKT
jgi:hypothetical protein